MSQVSSRLRRIALDAAGRRHDIVVPKNEVLAGALAAVGVHLGADDRVLGPDGSTVDVATSAADLTEGGLYAVATPPAPRTAHAATKRAGVRGVGPLPWALAGFAVVSALLAVEFGMVPTGASVVSGIAIGAAIATVVAAMCMVVPRSVRTRAAAAPLVVISALFALTALLSPMLGWSAAELLMVASAVSVVGIRAAPSMLVEVDPGYHIDYGRFMVLRWTVRGRVPELIERVEETRVREIVSAAEARLEATVRLLSVIAAAGLPAAVVAVTGTDMIVMISGWVFLSLACAGLLLTSRRMASSALRVPPRAAVLVGLLGFAVLFAPQAPGVTMTFAAVGLLAGALVAGFMVLPLARGERSLGWSRTGDIVDAIAIALVLPAGVVAAGTLELLQGVLA